MTGTPFTLHYASDRTPGRQASNSVIIPLSEATVPAPLDRIDLEILVAGQRIRQSFPPLPNQRMTFTWDGTDGYGRVMQGKQPLTMRIGYHYPAVYLGAPGVLTATFALLGSGVPISGSEAAPREGLTIWQEQHDSIGGWDARGLGLGGWSLSVHHAYDPAGQLLYLGNGERRSAQGSGFAIITTVAGTSPENFSGDGGPATQAGFFPFGVAVGPDGSFYIADGNNGRIRRVGVDGLISTVAGNGNVDFSGDGGPATQAGFFPFGVVVGPDGSLYITDSDNSRIRRVGADGLISTVAGNGNVGFSGDGGPATQAVLFSPAGVAVGLDGSLYIADTGNGRIRRVGVDGLISTVAGIGNGPFNGDGGPATQAVLFSPAGVAVAPDGSLYIADTRNGRIRRVGVDGLITTVAGNGNVDFSGDGGPATQAALFFPAGVAVGPDGSFYIADHNNSRIRRVGPDGIITTVAGSSPGGFSGDGGPATQAALSFPAGVAVGLDQSLYIADFNNRRIRRVASFLPGFSVADIFVSSADGATVYHFDASGRHLRTLNALTGAVLYQFSYDANGHLSQIRDGDNNLTTIERDSSGNPIAMVGPFGQRAPLTLDSNGFLATITNPASETVRFGYTSDGLLTSLTDPKGNVSQMTYDTTGRLLQDNDAAGGFQHFIRTDLANGYKVTRTTTLGRTTDYRVETLATGSHRLPNTFPDGTQSQLLLGADASRTTTLRDGTIVSLLKGPDPRFSMQASLPASRTITLPGGLAATTTMSRAVTLADPNNLLSLTALTNTLTLNGRTFTSAFTAATQTFTDTSAAGRQSTSVIDTLGRSVHSAIVGLFPVDVSYDARGRLAMITQGSTPDSRTTTFSYNGDGYVQTITDPAGRVIGFAYDPAGRVTTQTLPDGREIQYTYDANGNLASLTPPGRPPHGFTYTLVNLNDEYIPPEVGAGTNHTLYTYNADKQLTLITRPDGKTVSLDYDNAGRLHTQTIARGQTISAYDPTTGKKTTITAPDGGVLTYVYDGLLPQSASWSGTVVGSVSRTYDNNFRMTALQVNGANSIAFGYDNDGLLTRAGDLTLNRDAQNGLITGTTLGSTTDTRTHNGFGEMASFTAASNSTPLYQIQFTRDLLGRITTKTETIGGVTDTYMYHYDQAGRLDEVQKNGTVIASYSYDTNSNRLSVTRSGSTVTGAYDAQDRLMQYGVTTYTYTANGELQSKTISGQTTTYDYDELGNLLRVTFPGGTQINYVIDGQNRRIGKKVGGTMVQGFLYQDGLRPLAELDGSGTVVSRFVYGSRATIPDYLIKGGMTYRIFADHLGSPRLVVDMTTGMVVQRMDYDEFGSVLNNTNPGFQPFGFAGGLYDRDTELVRFGTRDYDGETGRWTTKDPIGFAGGDTSLYSYTGSDPINANDSNGLKSGSGWGCDAAGYVSKLCAIPAGLDLSRTIAAICAGAAGGLCIGDISERVLPSLVKQSFSPPAWYGPPQQAPPVSSDAGVPSGGVPPGNNDGMPGEDPSDAGIPPGDTPDGGNACNSECPDPCEVHIGGESIKVKSCDPGSDDFMVPCG